MSSACPSCGGSALETLLEQHEVPAQSNVLFDTREQALACPSADIRLAICLGCGFISNLAFDPAFLPEGGYEASQAASARFREYAQNLAATWIERHHLEGEAVLEIGTGTGEFIEWMCDAGAGRGIGVDPLLAPHRLQEAPGRITWVPERYDAKHLAPDVRAIVARHTLEHIGVVYDFMSHIRGTVPANQDVSILFEVPDVDRILDEVAFWDVYYEHAAYFSVDALRSLFVRAGFDVERIDRVYDNQYLIIDAKPASEVGDPTVDPAALAASIERARGFRDNYDRTIETLRAQFREYAARGQKVALWGAGSKATAYLFALGAERDLVQCVVDINPAKRGMFIAGAGHPIVAPDDVPSYRPDVVIVMNPIYIDEIRKDLVSRGVEAELTHA
ncbi:MAG: class I SAM-dependent methyltransferase [Dehalococcoidia bacterium]